jgi:hypothetical protein
MAGLREQQDQPEHAIDGVGALPVERVAVVHAADEEPRDDAGRAARDAEAVERAHAEEQQHVEHHELRAAVHVEERRLVPQEVRDGPEIEEALVRGPAAQRGAAQAILRVGQVEDAFVAPQEAPVGREVEEVDDGHDREADAQHRERAGIFEREDRATHRFGARPRPREQQEREGVDHPADVLRELGRYRRVARLVVEQGDERGDHRPRTRR